MKILLANLFFSFLLVDGFSQTNSIKKKPSLSNQSGYTITGFLKNAANKEIYLTENSFYKTEQKFDTAMANAKGQFYFKGKLDEVAFYSISVAGQNGRQFFYLENSPITITGDANLLSDSKVTGSREEDIRKKIEKIMADTAITASYQRAEMKYVNAKAVNDTRLMAIAIKDREVALEADRTRLKRFISTYPSATASVNLLGVLIELGDLPGADSLLTRMESTKIGKSLQARYFREQIDVMSKLIIGKMAPDFSQADPMGNQVKLSSFKGKFVLIDFWASWCGPCREENPNLVESYTTFKDKNFTILSVSLDNNKQNWLNAIQKDNLSWSHLSDLKGWKNEVAQQYGIKSIPANFLIDPSGKIIARDLRGQDLIKKIKEFISQ